MNVVSQVFEVARRLPDHPAVTSDAGTISYSGLMGRVARLAGSLRDMVGCAPGDRVVLCMENCPEFFDVLLACWTAGLCVAPINSKLHPKEIAYIVEKTNAKALFAGEAQADALGSFAKGGSEVVPIGSDRYAQLLNGEPMRPLAVSPADPAWLFFTSGTTGRPKGAVLTHRNLMFMSHAYLADIDFIDESDTNLHAAPLSHGSGLYALPHLFKGSHHVIAGGSFEPARILEQIARHPNVSFFGAPTMLTRLVQSEAIRRADLTNLKTIIYGGGPMYVADLKRALAAFGPRLYQLFGQGESPMTITGLSKRFHGAADHPRYEALLASCGYARTGVEVKIVGEDDREVPFGEPGEVVCRSDAVMQGYLDDPQATAEALRGGWLYTGDVGSMDADGLLTLRDRSKDLIISGGSNIYPREIEEVLLRHPDVVEAAVVGRPHPEWGEEVVAFVVVRPGAAVNQPALDAICLDNIARYKRPRHYRFVEGLPKNNYGKVLKAELRRRLEQASG
jgi:acyl-CoA synthetase (AMP-forming)/AMP-acid ligase II